MSSRKVVECGQLGSQLQSKDIDEWGKKMIICNQVEQLDREKHAHY